MLTEKMQRQLKVWHWTGLSLTIIGALLLIFAALIFKTYVTSIPDLGDSEAAQSAAHLLIPESTHNIGLIAQQQALLLLGGFTMLTGVILRVSSFFARMKFDLPSVS